MCFDLSRQDNYGFLKFGFVKKLFLHKTPFIGVVVFLLLGFFFLVFPKSAFAAVVNFNGFETGTTLESSFSGAGSSVQSTIKRTGNYAYRTNPTTTAIGFVNLGVPNTSGQSSGINMSGIMYARFYFYVATLPSANDEEIFCAASTPTVCLRVTSTGVLKLYNNEDTTPALLATGITTLSTATWYRIEVSLDSSSSAAYEVLVNGVSDISGTGANFSDTNWFSAFFGKHTNINSNTVDFYYDDIAVSDSGYLGAGRVSLMSPDSEGFYTDWTGSYTDVKEVPHDSDTTYITSSTSAQAKTVGLQSAASAGATGTINAIKSVVIARDEGGTSGLKLRLRSGSTDNNTTPGVNLTTSYALLSKVFATDPADGLAWTTADLDGVEAGVLNNVSVATRVTAIYVMVDSTGNVNPSTPSSLGGFVSGSYTNHTTPTLTFTLSDPDSADTVKYQIQIDDSSDFSSPVVDYTSVLAAQEAASFTVGQAAGSGSYTTGSLGQTLSDGSYYWQVKAIDNSAASSSYATANSGAIAFIVDTTVPSGGSITYIDGYYTSASVALAVSDGSDAGSGIDTSTRTVQRKSATLSAGSCGTYGSFGTISTTGSYPSLTDTSVASGNCYIYEYLISDVAGNQATYTSSNVVKVDTGSPSTPGTPSTTSPTNSSAQTWVWTAATDTFSGIANYAWRVVDPSNNPIVSGTTATLSVITNLTQGIYTFFVKAVDNAGNSGSETSGSVTVNTTAPTGSISINSGATNTNSLSVTLTLSATDDTDSASQLQMIVSNDSGFGGASYESYATSKTWTLVSGSDGTRTVYVRYKDTTDNVSSTYSANIVLDVTVPAGINLDSPGDQNYTNSDRPTFRWQATTDATSGLSKYVLVVSNPSIESSQPSGNFTIDNIPTSGTTDINVNKYSIHFDGFNDSDPNNNYISVSTKSSSDWETDNNDGKLREGKVSWKVEAIDNAGNETDASRTLFVDKTSPNVDISQIDSTLYSVNSTNSFVTTNKTPTVFGKITDNLGGTIPDGQTQDENGPKVASGPKSIEVKLEQQGFLGTYTLNTLATVNITQMFRSDNGNIITNNSQSPASKFSGFSYTLPSGLSNGTYRLTFTSQDNSGNTGTTLVFSLTIGYGSQTIITQPKPKPGSNSSLSPTNPSGSPTPTPEKIVTLQKEQQPKGPSFLTRIVGGVLTFGSNVIHYVADVGSAGANSITRSVKTPTHLAGNLGTWIAYTATTFPEMVIDTQPTKISDVQISQITKTTAIISWKTNHHTFNNKVNYGQDLSYGHDAFAPDYTKDHSVEIDNLKPGLKYVFEVMSQNKNYVYDAAHEFTTSK